ncbi:MAG: hypothetical protein EBV23_01875 [Flavobacteriia bacterium]|nr:hypothetical protein [Flavobacteriia bacterium]
MKTILNEQNLEFNRIGVVAMMILVVGCLGGLAMGLGAVQSTATLIVVVIPTMITLCLLLAVAPMRWIYAAGIWALSTDLILILYFTVA